MANERTLVILKPDAIKRNQTEPRLIVNIFGYFSKEGLVLVRSKYVKQATKEQLDNHFPNNEQWVIDMGVRALGRVKNPIEVFGTDDPQKIGATIIQGCREYYLSGPLIACVFEGENAVKRARGLLGSALPSKAAKGTIRGDLGEHEKTGSIAATRNLIHASDAVHEAEREINAWFTK